MNNLYRKLAITNIRSNTQFYLPYLFAGIVSVMMFYCMRAIQGNDGFNNVRGSATIIMVLSFGTIVIGIIDCILMFYTNSFIMKRRKKELGIYNILGMEKRHIARVMLWEMLFTFGITLSGGLVVGVVFNKLFTMLIYRLTGLAETIPFEISPASCVATAELFAVIYLACFIYDFLQIQIANPIELLQGGNAGEKEPKTKILMSILGVACLGGGYYISITTDNPLAAINLFFMAVVLVIIGTQLLFTSGSIALLKLLRKNKRFYYQTKHFTTISGMIYRMKQNATGLSNICILSTMVLVMISTTVSMYVGLEDELQTRYGGDVVVEARFTDIPSKEQRDLIFNTVEQSITDSGRRILTQEQRATLGYFVDWQENQVNINTSESMLDGMVMMDVMTKEDGASLYEGSMPELQDNEVMVLSYPAYTESNIIVEGREYKVAGTVELNPEGNQIDSMLDGQIYLLMANEEAQREIFTELQAICVQKDRRIIEPYYGVEMDTDGTREEKLAEIAAVRAAITTLTTEGGQLAGACSISVESREEGRESFLMNNGAFVFLGIFLGSLFLIVTVLIIYYKQISEGYEDKERYLIMEKVGMSNTEVKGAIRSQILLIFFLPLAMAGVHSLAATPMLIQILVVMNLMNQTLFYWCLLVTLCVFAVIYLAIFLLTSKSYYKIVGNQV